MGYGLQSFCYYIYSLGFCSRVRKYIENFTNTPLFFPFSPFFMKGQYFMNKQTILEIFGIDQEEYNRETIEMAKVSSMRGDGFTMNDISMIVFTKHLDKQINAWYERYMSGKLS